MRAFGLLILIMTVACFNNGSLVQYTLSNGVYMSFDSLCTATLDIPNRTLFLNQHIVNKTGETIVIGSNFVVKGCPTNFSYSCEMQCYRLVADTLKILDRTISDPVIGPIGNSTMIICSEPQDKTSGGAGLFPQGDTTGFIELKRQ